MIKSRPLSFVKSPNVSLSILPYEINHAVWQAERRKRITPDQAERILQSFSRLDIEIIAQSWERLLPLACRFERTVYDAAYLALAQETSQPLLTGDLRLYHPVHARLDWVMWIVG